VWERPYKTLTFVPKDGCFVNVQQLQVVVATLRPSDFINKQLDRNPFVVLSQPASSIHKNGLFMLADGMIANGKKMEDMTLKYFGQDLVAEITRACIDRNYEEVEEHGTNNNGDHQQTKWHFGEDGSRSSSAGISSTTTDSRSSIKKMKNSNENDVSDNNPFLCDISSISSSSLHRKTHYEEEGINYLILFIVFYLYIFLCSIVCVH
jgi:hypothetical protein